FVSWMFSDSVTQASTPGVAAGVSPPPLRSGSPYSLSTHCVDVIPRFVGSSTILTDSQAMEPVQPKVIGMAGDEARRDADLHSRRQISAEELVMAIIPKIDHPLIG